MVGASEDVVKGALAPVVVGLLWAVSKRGFDAVVEGLFLASAAGDIVSSGMLSWRGEDGECFVEIVWRVC